MRTIIHYAYEGPLKTCPLSASWRGDLTDSWRLWVFASPSTRLFLIYSSLLFRRRRALVRDRLDAFVGVTMPTVMMLRYVFEIVIKTVLKLTFWTWKFNMKSYGLAHERDAKSAYNACYVKRGRDGLWSDGNIGVVLSRNTLSVNSLKRNRPCDSFIPNLQKLSIRIVKTFNIVSEKNQVEFKCKIRCTACARKTLKSIF